MKKSSGISPLVCVVCQETVGIINSDALAMMLGADECYVCRVCMALDEDAVAATLAAQPPDHYAHLVSRALVAQQLDGGDVSA